MGISIGALPLSRLVFARGLHLRDDFDALAGWWTSDVGTAAVVGGALQGATMGDVLLNAITNGEFTADIAGWSSADGGTEAEHRDFTAAPNIAPTGGADNYGAAVWRVSAGPSGGLRNYDIPFVHSAIWVIKARAYSPSANTAVNAAALVGSNWVGDYPATTVEDVWQTLIATGRFTATPLFRLNVASSTVNDIVYFDKVEARRQNTVLTAQCKPTGTVQAGVAMPAAGVVPRSVIMRRSDALNYWEARLTPNTAATDLQLYEVNAGAHQLRASADIDWTAGATDEVQVSLKGATIEVYHRKAGAAVWTLGCSYASATHNQTTARHGGMLWETGVNAFTYWSYTS